MKYFLHDLSKLTVSLLGITLNAVGCGREKIKNKIFSCLSNHGFVSRDEFAVFTSVIQDVKLQQNAMAEQMKNNPNATE